MTHTRLPADIEQRALSLFESCQSLLDDMIGVSLRQFQTVVIRQSSNGPTIEIDGDTAVLLVGPHATSCESSLVSNVAHESVHLHLTDGTFGNASGLEEGFAVHFELSTVEQHYGPTERQRHIEYLPSTYATTLRDYVYLLSISDAPALLVRELHGKLTGVSRRDLRCIFPQLGWWMSYRLARRKRMRSG